MVNGPSPGPAPAAQARASSSRLTRSNWRTWPHRKLRRKVPRKVPRVDGAFTTQPRAPAVPPVRNTSASSMQSPPASADATRVTILSPVLARPGARPKSRCRSTSRAVQDAWPGWLAGSAQHWPPDGGRRRRFGSGRGAPVAASCILTLARDNSSYVAVRSAADR